MPPTTTPITSASPAAFQPPGRSSVALPAGQSADVGALDGAEELLVGLALAHPVDHQLEGLGRVERAEHAAQLPGDHQLLLAEQQLLLAGRGGVHVEGGEDAALRELAVQPHLHVPGALELLEDHLVHARAGVDQRRRQDGERAALLQVPRRAEEALGRVQGRGVDTAGEDLAARRCGQVVGAGQAGDAVEQHDHVAAVLDHALGLLDGQLRDLAVLVAGAVEGGVDHLRLGGALHVGDLFGPLVGEQADEVHLGVVLADGVGDLLHQRGLARLGRGDDQPALALPDGAHQVHDARRDLGRVVLQAQPLLRVQRGQVLELAPPARLLGVALVDLLDPGERGVLLGVPRELDHTLDLVAAAQAEAADHRERHVDVVGAGRERAHPQEAVAVLGADVQGAGADHLGAVVGLAATGVAALHHADAALALLEAVAPVAVAVAAPAAAGLLAAGVPAATAAPALVPVLPALAVAAPLAAVLAAVRALLGLAGRTLLALATAAALLLLAAGALLGLAVAGVLLGLGGRLAVATLLARALAAGLGLLGAAALRGAAVGATLDRGRSRRGGQLAHRGAVALLAAAAAPAAPAATVLGVTLGVPRRLRRLGRLGIRVEQGGLGGGVGPGATRRARGRRELDALRLGDDGTDEVGLTQPLVALDPHRRGDRLQLGQHLLLEDVSFGGCHLHLPGRWVVPTVVGRVVCSLAGWRAGRAGRNRVAEPEEFGATCRHLLGGRSASAPVPATGLPGFAIYGTSGRGGRRRCLLRRGH